MVLDMAATYSYWCHSSVLVFWRSFAIVDVEASRITCCRGNRASFTLVRVIAAILQPAVAAQATLVDWSIPGLVSFTRRRTEIMAEGSCRPEKRPDSRQDRKSLSRAVKYCLLDASRCQASNEHRTPLSCQFSADKLTVVSQQYGRQSGLFAQWLHIAVITASQLAIADACMVTVGASRWYFSPKTTFFPHFSVDLEGTVCRIWFWPRSQERFWSSRVRLILASLAQ